MADTSLNWGLILVAIFAVAAIAFVAITGPTITGNALGPKGRNVIINALGPKGRNVFMTDNQQDAIDIANGIEELTGYSCFIMDAKDMEKDKEVYMIFCMDKESATYSYQAARGIQQILNDDSLPSIERAKAIKSILNADENEILGGRHPVSPTIEGGRHPVSPW